MKQCLNCSKEFQEKRKTAKFCSTSCRVLYNRKHSGKGSGFVLNAQVLYNQTAGLLNEIKKLVENSQLPKDSKEVNKKQEIPLPNPDGVIVITLEKLREMCPPELTGIDRTMWIQEQRKKYGI